MNATAYRAACDELVSISYEMAGLLDELVATGAISVPGVREIAIRVLQRHDLAVNRRSAAIEEAG